MDAFRPFLEAIDQRLHQGRFLRGVLWATVLVSAVLLVIAGIYFLQGEAVPLRLFPIALGSLAVVSLILMALPGPSDDTAAALADRYFDLNDSVTSARRFEQEGRRGGFYDLQRTQTEERLAALRARDFRLPFPGRLAAIAGVLVLAAASTSFVPPSPEALAKAAQEEAVLAKSEEVNEALEEALNALDREITDPMERELLQADQMREWLDQLKTTKDLKEAMRQYASLERRVAQSTSRLDQRRDEQLLAKAGEELRKEADHRQLGQQLKTQKYKDAAQKLKEMQLRAKKDEKKQGKNLAEERKRLKKLKSAAKRMASASRSSRGKRNGSGDLGDGESSEALNELLEKLEELADKLGLDMDDMEMSESDGPSEKLTPEQLKELLDQMDRLDLDLDNLGQRLRKMDAKKNLQGKLRLLGMRLSKAQGYLAGNLQSPFASPGGLKPGEGTSEERRKERDALVDNGQYTQLQGLKGRGPSQTQIQDSAEGSGVSQLQAEDVDRTYAKQLEAFVQREDVPEDVKDGVRDYFTNIHQLSTQPTTTTETE